MLQPSTSAICPMSLAVGTFSSRSHLMTDEKLRSRATATRSRLSPAASRKVRNRCQEN